MFPEWVLPPEVPKHIYLRTWVVYCKQPVGIVYGCAQAAVSAGLFMTTGRPRQGAPRRVLRLFCPVEPPAASALPSFLQAWLGASCDSFIQARRCARPRRARGRSHAVCAAAGCGMPPPTIAAARCCLLFAMQQIAHPWAGLWATHPTLQGVLAIFRSPNPPCSILGTAGRAAFEAWCPFRGPQRPAVVLVAVVGTAAALWLLPHGCPRQTGPPLALFLPRASHAAE